MAKGSVSQCSVNGSDDRITAAHLQILMYMHSNSSGPLYYREVVVPPLDASTEAIMQVLIAVINSEITMCTYRSFPPVSENFGQVQVNEQCIGSIPASVLMDL